MVIFHCYVSSPEGSSRVIPIFADTKADGIVHVSSHAGIETWQPWQRQGGKLYRLPSGNLT